jgi:hypothetical protein
VQLAQAGHLRLHVCLRIYLQAATQQEQGGAAASTKAGGQADAGELAEAQSKLAEGDTQAVCMHHSCCLSIQTMFSSVTLSMP